MRIIRSTFVRAAQRLGLLSSDDAEKADALIEKDPEHSSADIVVDAGMLSEDQAARVDAERKTIDLEGYVNDKFKCATRIVAETTKSAERLRDATQPVRVEAVLAAKRKAGIG